MSHLSTCCGREHMQGELGERAVVSATSAHGFISWLGIVALAYGTRQPAGMSQRSHDGYVNRVPLMADARPQ